MALDSLRELLSKKNLMRVDEVANLFQVSKMTVYRWCKRGLLKSCKVSGSLRIYTQSLLDTFEGKEL